jgi:hypothetical protein
LLLDNLATVPTAKTGLRNPTFAAAKCNQCLEIGFAPAIACAAAGVGVASGIDIAAGAPATVRTSLRKV